MRSLIPSLTFALAIGCAGNTPPPGGNPTADANTTDSPILEEEGQKVSGKAMDYWSGDPMADLAIETDGVTPAMIATSVADGSYVLEGVPVGSMLYLSAQGTGYRATRNVATNVGDTDVTQDIYAVTDTDIRRQYTTLGRSPQAGTAFVAGELQRDNGTPLEGVPLANVTLVDGNDQPVPNVLGPYFFGAAGDIDAALTTSTAFGGRARVAFLDVPPGSFSLKVVETETITHIAAVTASADGAVLAIAGGMGTPGGGGGNPLNPSFATDIYPRLQKASQGGLGCANCHTNGGSGGVLRYDDPAPNVLDAIKARPGVLDLVTPENSLLLTKPLYEPPPAPQNHPNATFLDVNDPDYKLILLWIQQGAQP